MCGNHPSNKGGMTTVIDMIRRHDWEKDGIDLSFIPTFFPSNSMVKILFFALSLVRVFIRFSFDRPDVLYTHMSYKGSFTRTKILCGLAKLFRIRTIVHLHASNFGEWYFSENPEKQRAVKSFLEEIDTLVVLGSNTAKLINTIQPDTHIVIIHNAVDEKKECVSWAEPIKLLYTGVLIKRKGVQDLLEAMIALKDKGITLTIAGSGSEEENLRNFCLKNGLEENVTFLGWKTQDELKGIYLSHQVFVLPSYAEGLPMSILEAMSYGMPIVATDVGDTSSAVIDSLNGLIFQASSVQQLIENIIIINNKDAFNTMSLESMRLVKDTFSTAVFFTKLRGLFISI